MQRLTHILFIFILQFPLSLVFAAPATPEAVYPLGGSIVPTSSELTFAWQPVDRTIRYDLFAVNIDSSEIAFRNRNVSTTRCDNSSCSLTVSNPSFASPARFVWRIAAISTAGRSGFSHARFDLVDPSPPSPPSPPVPIAPTTETDPVEGEPLTFSWQVSALADSYDMFVYDQTANQVVFRDVVVEKEIYCDTSKCKYSAASIQLPVADNHVWRVAARNRLGRSSFSRSSFNVRADLPPPAPRPIAPSSDQPLPIGTPITFRWQTTQNAESYDFFVHELSSGSTVIRDTALLSDICVSDVCSITIDETRFQLGLYVWRVAAKNSSGRSSFSHTRFRIEPEDSATPRTIRNIDQYELVFNDEFDGSELDTDKWDTALLWGPYLPINNEQQLYVDSSYMHSSFPWTPFEFTGDTLRIIAEPVTAQLQPPPRPPADSPLWNRGFTQYRFNPDYDPANVEYLSGTITSYENFKMTHGYVEARIKLPAGKGLWPAFWMLPTHYVEDVPEIDIMEFLGDNVNRIYNTYHYFDIANGWRLISTPSFFVERNDWTKNFHTFGMEWSPRRIRWYVDGQLVNEINDSEWEIANQPMFLLANLAVGGNWPGDADATTPFPAVFEIDYIRAYKRKLPAELDLSKYQVMFEDEFDGDSLDPNKWNTHFLWGPYLQINNEEQYYIDSLGSDAELGYTPFQVSGGNLTITARAANDPEGAPPPALPGINDPIWTNYPTFQRDTNYTPGGYTSGIITSYDAFKFANGYAEIRAKIPKGAGTWPAFWLLNAYYVGPQPEIDVLEVRGELPNQIVHTYHRRNSDGIMFQTDFLTDNGKFPDGYSADFHVYGVRWERGRITWYVDGEPVHSYSGDDVAYQIMYVLLNLAVGGDFHFSVTDPSAFAAEFVIDYVRVWQEKELP